MKKLVIVTFVSLITSLLCGHVRAQNQTLELSWNGSWNPLPGPTQGPSLSPQFQTFQADNSNSSVTTAGNFVNYITPGLTVTTSLRNQLFTGFNYSGIQGTVTTGLSFGTQKSEYNDPTILTQGPRAGDLYGLLGANTGNSFGPLANQYKSKAGALAGTIDPDNTQFGSDANGGVNLFSTVEPLKDLNLAKDGRYEYGELVITFSLPVKDPVINIASLGGSSWYLPSGSLDIPANYRISYFTTELELQNTGVTSAALAGTAYLSVVGNKILNSAAQPNGDSRPGNFTVKGGSSYGAVSGSIQITGVVQELVYKVFVRGATSSDYNFSFRASDVGAMRNPFYGDFWSIGYSLAKPTQQITGIVFNDKDGLTDNNINQSGGLPNVRTNVSNGLYANLLNAANFAVATVPVGANGAYLFDNVPVGTYTIQLTTIASAGTYAVPVAAPATVLPMGWVNTGEFIGSGFGSDGLVNGLSAPVNVLATNIKTEVNFGIERLPDSKNFTDSINQPFFNETILLSTPGGVRFGNRSILTGSDPEDQPIEAVLTGKSVKFTTLATVGVNNIPAVLSYNGVPITLNQVIPNFNSALLTVTMPSAANPWTGFGLRFSYAYVDAAGQPDPTPAVYKLEWKQGFCCPIILSDFVVSKNNCTARLNWKTAQELNGDRFEIEVSTNINPVYNSVGSVLAVGTSTTTQSYQYSYAMQAGVVYYFRLKMIDVGGAFKYSDIRSANCSKGGGGIVIAPNPTIDKFTIQGMENGKNSISVYGANGQLVKTQIIAQNQGEVNIAYLAPGMYTVKIISEAGNTVINKMIKY